MTAPSVPSYFRLTPHRWSPTYNNFGYRDRESAVRICPVFMPGTPDDVARKFHFEYRAADAAASPYLVLAALLKAGLTGLDEGLFSLVAGILERALGRHPEYADLHYHCARVYERLGRDGAAIDAAQKAVSLNPNYVQALIQLGRLYAAEDETLEARDRLCQAIACGGDYPDVHYLIGEMYRRDGNRPSAADAYRRALEINRNFDRARIALADVAPVVAIMGDGAFLMTGLELMTAAQLKVPVALFVLRDRELTQIAQFQDTAFAHRCASDLPDFELGDLCAGLGVRHLRIAGDAELDAAVAEVRARLEAGPVVAEVAVDNRERTYFTQGVVRTNFGRLPWGERLHFVARALGRRAFG